MLLFFSLLFFDTTVVYTVVRNTLLRLHDRLVFSLCSLFVLPRSLLSSVVVDHGLGWVRSQRQAQQAARHLTQMQEAALQVRLPDETVNYSLRLVAVNDALCTAVVLGCVGEALVHLCAVALPAR